MAGGRKKRVSSRHGAGKLSQEISRPISSPAIGTLLLYFHSWKMAPGSQSGLPISSNKHRFVSRWKVLIRGSPFACNNASPIRRRLTVKIPPCGRKNKSTFVSCTVCDLVPFAAARVCARMAGGIVCVLVPDHTAIFANIRPGYRVVSEYTFLARSRAR